MNDTDKFLQLIADEYHHLSRYRERVGIANVTPERILDNLAGNLMTEQMAAHFCHGYGQPHIWQALTMDGSEFASSCTEHPTRRMRSGGRRQWEGK